jgi:NADPH:quinone reductase-like Zn-dependent oxidoreductase
MAPGDAPPSGRRWDVILDTVGVMTVDRARDWLSPGGRLALVSADLPQMIAGATARLGQGRRVLFGAAGERADDLTDLAALASAGLFRPLIGATFPLDDIVLAHHSAAGGHKLGSTVVTMV